MTAGNVPRPIVYGTLVGGVLGSLLLVAGWTSPNWAAYTFLGVSILICGIGGGLLVAYGPKSVLPRAASLSPRRLTLDNLLARILPGALIGLAVGPVVLAVSAFIIGGLGRAAPCHSAPDFLSGAIFAVFAFGFLYGLPALGIGAVIGAIVAAVLHERASLGVITLVTAAVMFAALLTWVLTH